MEADIRWITTGLPTQYVMHTMQANVRDGKLLLDAPIFNRPPFPFEQDFAEGDGVALFFSIPSSSFIMRSNCRSLISGDAST